MARFTMTIAELSELYDIFDFEYQPPMSVEKSELEQDFYDIYSQREIAYETFEIWYPKFKHAWRETCKKYFKMFYFANSMEVGVDYTKSRNVTSMNEVTSNSKTKTIPTPIENQLTENAIPNQFSVSDGTSEGEGTVFETENKRTRSEVEIYNEYVQKFKTTMESFMNELKPLFFKRY